MHVTQNLVNTKQYFINYNKHFYICKHMQCFMKLQVAVL